MRGPIPPGYARCVSELDAFTARHFGRALSYRIRVREPGEPVIASDGSKVLGTIYQLGVNLFKGREWIVDVVYENACHITAHEIITHLVVIEIEGDRWGNRDHARKDLEQKQIQFQEEHAR